MRTAISGIVSEATRPSAENSATIVPPRAGVPPASTSSFGNQVNIEYVTSEVMPNINAMPQATGERHARPAGRGAASSGASSSTVTAASCTRARGEALLRSCHSTRHHGTADAAANTAHSPSEMRQPAASITGTATSAGRMVPACSTVMYSVLTVPTRSAK